MTKEDEFTVLEPSEAPRKGAPIIWSARFESLAGGKVGRITAKTSMLLTQKNISTCARRYGYVVKTWTTGDGYVYFTAEKKQ